MTNNLEKLSLGELVRKIISIEFAYHAVMEDVNKEIVQEHYILDRVNAVFSIKLDPLYAELDRRE